jgi:outer membrane protein, heavy metal efflux system
VVYLNDKNQYICFSCLKSLQSIRWLVFLSVFFLSACVKHQYVAEPIDQTRNVEEILIRDHQSQQFRSFLENNQYPQIDWPINKWDLNKLTLLAVFFNPEIQVAKSELAIQRASEIIAGQKPNPTVGIPIEHHDGSAESPWFIGLVTDFLFERSEKADAVMEQAVAKSNAAKIKLEQKVWYIYSELHKNLIEYFAAIKHKKLLNTQKDLLDENLALLTRRQELGQVSQFELSSVRLQLQHIQLQLSDQDYIINNAFHNLIAETGLQVDKFNQKDFDFSQIESGLDIVKLDEDSLRKDLLNNRFDVRIKLEEYDVLEAALKLEITKQYPDINLSPGFIFDQGSNVWALGASWVLPLFHNHEGEIEEALAKRTHMQAEFISLQTGLINELDRKYQNYVDKLTSYKNSLMILKELEDRTVQIQKQFDLGYSDHLALIQMQLEVEKARQAIFAIKVNVLQSLEQLENITQQALNDDGLVKMLMKNIQREIN